MVRIKLFALKVAAWTLCNNLLDKNRALNEEIYDVLYGQVEDATNQKQVIDLIVRIYGILQDGK